MYQWIRDYRWTITTKTNKNFDYKLSEQIKFSSDKFSKQYSRPPVLGTGGKTKEEEESRDVSKDSAMERLLESRGLSHKSNESSRVLARQEKIIYDAYGSVHSAAEIANPVNDSMNLDLELMREKALQKLMGIELDNDGVKVPPGAPRDLSAARARRSSDIVEAIRGCETLECISVANTRPKGNAKFNFPHFYIVGWQKTVSVSF